MTKGQVPEDLKRAVHNMDNLIFEPVSSIELAQFYNLEGKHMGLMFYKNLVDSVQINDEQGAIYFFKLDEQARVCQKTGSKL